MSRDLRPKTKYLRRFGLIGEQEEQRQQKLRKKSEYGKRLEEKQKIKFIYGIKERQLKNYYEQAMQSRQEPTEKLFQLLESRLDNVVYRLGFAATRPSSRQLVSHGHVLVNGKRVTIPSFNVSPGQNIELKEKSKKIPLVKESLAAKKENEVQSWLSRTGYRGRVDSLPNKDQIRKDVDISAIIAFYS